MLLLAGRAKVRQLCEIVNAGTQPVRIALFCFLPLGVDFIMPCLALIFFCDVNRSDSKPLRPTPCTKAAGRRGQDGLGKAFHHRGIDWCQFRFFVPSYLY